MKLLFSKKELGGILVILLLFIIASYFSSKYEDLLSNLIGNDVFGMAVYILLTVVAVVIAPISTFPLLPIASALWGYVIAALLSIFAWTIGGAIAFIIARKYGRPLVSKLIDINKVDAFSRVVLGKNPFFSIIFLRIVVPVDILSYALGLAPGITFSLYILATAIGVTPFAFIFSYASSLPLLYQLAVLVLAAILIVVGYLRARRANEGNLA